MGRLLAVVVMLAVVLPYGSGASAAPPAASIFTPQASFLATQFPELGTPFGGLGYDATAGRIGILARYVPNAVRPLTLFEFDAAPDTFGRYVRDFRNGWFAGPETEFPAITVDTAHGVTYLLQDQGDRLVINPRHTNPRNAPNNNGRDFVVAATGAAGVTYDERDGVIVLLLYSDGRNGGQQIVRIPTSPDQVAGGSPAAGVTSRTPVDARVAVNRDSEITLDPRSGRILVSSGAQVVELTADGRLTGRSFTSPNGGVVMGMEFGLGSDFVLLEASGLVTRGVLDSPLLDVRLDIKPGGGRNSINPRSRGNVPVGILSTSQFNAVTQVDITSLTFGRTGDERSLLRCAGAGEDVNGDGLKDLVCHFDTQRSAFNSASTEGILKGRSRAGVPFSGRDAVHIVGR